MSSYHEDQLVRLRAALERTSGDSGVDALVRGSLALAVHGDPVMEAAYRSETAPRQVEVDLHLVGESVDGHSTNAHLLAAFISQVSVATKAVAKQMAGTKKHRENLLIDGVMPGSVRVVLRAPDPPADGQALPGSEVETVDSKALRRVARVFALASDDQEGERDGLLAAAVDGLPVEARDSLRSAAHDVMRAGWQIDGAVRQWRQPEDTIRVTAGGAEQLRTALALRVPEKQRRRVVGTLDGFRRSTGVAYMSFEDEDRPLAVTVVDADLFHEVAHMAAVEGLPVRATIEEWQVVRPDGSPGRVSRRLWEIESLGSQPEFEE